jgi:ubiquinone/menaquinone biosynthesis C-methylase UbiE
VIANATDLPFDDAQFDVGLLLTVLHHTPDPDRVLREAARVANRLIVIEDTFHSPGKRRLVELADSIANLEFRGHPHRNRTDAQWRRTLASLGLQIAAERTDRVFAFFEQRTYAVDTGYTQPHSQAP